MSPSEQEFPLDLRISIEYLSGDGSFSNGTILGIPRYDKVAAETTLALYDLRTEELSQSTG